MLIFSNSSLLASPDKNDIKRIHIIFNKVGDDYDKLTSLFLKFSLAQDGEIRATTPEIYQLCFQYTVTAKIAPVWNVLGNMYLINNRDFLTASGPQTGIQYIFSSDAYVTTLDLKAVKINFMRTTESYNPGEWIRVLPSLNKAVIEEFSEVLPRAALFKCYKDLRRHWKNIVNITQPCTSRGIPTTHNCQYHTHLCQRILWMLLYREVDGCVISIGLVLGLLIVGHGYRLPEEECPYYLVRFWRGEPLTYPQYCLTRNYPIITPVPKQEEDTTISRFLACLINKSPRVLGSPLHIQLQGHEDQPMKHIEQLSDTQAISLCTPTQVWKK